MTLAARSIDIELWGGVIRLKPTLRAAIRLERDYGFDRLFRLLSQGSMTATTAILAEHVEHVPPVRLNEIAGLTPKLAAYLVQLVDLGEQKGSGSGERIAWGAFFDRLFGIGTGMLGWTPAETYAASPHEILAAYDGRREMLSASPIEDSSADTPNFKADPDRRAKLKALPR